MFYFMDDSQITVILENGTTMSWKKSSPVFTQVMDMCRKQDWIAVEAMSSLFKGIMSGKVEVIDDKTIRLGDTTYQSADQPMVRFVDLLRKRNIIDRDIEAAKPFFERLRNNRYIDAINEVCDFCLNGDFAITVEGDLLAYKKVRADLSSVHDSGKTKHVLGQYTEVDRFDTNRENTCSEGLHFCSYGYLDSYSGDATIIVKIHPEDIVSIPTDHHYMKGRCRRYMPVGVINGDKRLEEINIEQLTGCKVISLKKREPVVEDEPDYDDVDISDVELYVHNYEGREVSDHCICEMEDWTDEYLNEIRRYLDDHPEAVRRELQ